MGRVAAVDSTHFTLTAPCLKVNPPPLRSTRSLSQSLKKTNKNKLKSKLSQVPTESGVKSLKSLNVKPSLWGLRFKGQVIGF